MKETIIYVGIFFGTLLLVGGIFGLSVSGSALTAAIGYLILKDVMEHFPPKKK